MKRYSGRFIIKSTRITNWDYSTPGIYFITICTTDHDNYFGEIVDNKIEYNEQGIIAVECLNEIEKHFDNVKIMESVVMPNHVHILIEVTKTRSNSVETHHGASLPIKYQSYHFHRLAIKSNQTIPKIISQYKSTVSRKIGLKNGYFGWQSRFYDVIIRNEKQLLTVKNYIINNIRNWKKDKYFKKHVIKN